MDDPTWSTLGDAIRRARSEHDARVARRSAFRVLAELQSVLHGREGIDAALAALATELETVSADAWCMASSSGAERELALRDVWKTLEDTWAWADGEGRERFVSQLAEDLAEVDASLRRAMDAVPALRESLDAQPPFSCWPLRSLGGARALHAEAVGQIEARSGIPRRQMLQPDAIDDEEVFVLEDEAHAAGDLEAALALRAAWSEALHALGDALPDEMRERSSAH